MTPKSWSNPKSPCARTIGYLVFVYVQLKRQKAPAGRGTLAPSATTIRKTANERTRRVIHPPFVAASATANRSGGRLPRKEAWKKEDPGSPRRQASRPPA